MKNKSLVICLIALLFTGPLLFASITTSSEPTSAIIVDSLILKKSNTSKSISLPSGIEIKLWHDEYQTIKGTFIRNQNDQILIESNGVEKLIAIDQIQRIKVIGSKPKLGQLFLTIGTAVLVLGGISLIAGLASLSSDSIGAIVLVAVPFLGGAGLGLRAIGNKLGGNSFNLTKKWRIEK